MPGPTPPADPASVQRRERGLRRVGTATRWTATAALAGTFALGAGYAQALPGNADTPTGDAQHSPTTGRRPRPPAQAPTLTPQPPQTSSGAS